MTKRKPERKQERGNDHLRPPLLAKQRNNRRDAGRHISANKAIVWEEKAWKQGGKKRKERAIKTNDEKTAKK